MAEQNDLLEEDDEYYIPLVDQRVFGAGLKRKRIAFVPAALEDSTIRRLNPSTSAGNRYLSIVLPQKSVVTPQGIDSSTEIEDGPSESTAEQKPSLQVGSLPITSIAHQLSLEHSHPPSHLDRSRLGVKYLQEYGWDPDAREGLGSRREGIRLPVKAKQKSDTAGLGLFTKDDEDRTGKEKKTGRKPSPNKPVKLDAKQVRRIEEGKRVKGEKLRQSVYGEDWSRYLGSEG